MVAPHYLSPADLTPDETGTVLDFLNEVSDAATIARRVEFPDELDVGEKVGQRLLDARALLGGRFDDLDQVLAVPYLGAERFTEIVCALTGRPLPWTLPDVRQEIRRLMGMMEQMAVAPSASIVVSHDPPRPLLGQPVNLLIRVTDSERRPLANRPLTIETNQGALTNLHGFQVNRGEVVDVVTGADGSARVQLAYQAYENLTEDQRVALERELNLLDDTAGSPSELAHGFARFSEHYRLENNHHLRAALDIYFREMERLLDDSINHPDFLLQWHYKTALVRIYLHPPAVDPAAGHVATVNALAAYPVRWKNWVAPWYQWYVAWLQRDSALDSEFKSAKGVDSHRLVDRMLGYSQVFMAGQRGRLGVSAGKAVVSKAMTRFLAEDVVELPLDQQQILFPTLSVAANSVKSAGDNTLALVAQTRVDIERTVSEKVRVDVDGVNQKIDAFNKDYQTFRSDKSAFDRNYTSFNSRYPTFDANYKDFDGRYRTFDANYKDFDGKYQTFTADYKDFDGKYQTFDKNYATFNADLVQFNTEKVTLDADVKALRTDLNKVSKDVTAIDRKVNRNGDVR